ncbi:ASP-1 protein, partial [Aphelenchoides avenae]
HPKPSASYPGVITFGGLNTKNCDANWVWTPLKYTEPGKYKYWQFTLQSFSVGSQNIRVNDVCISDTGTSWINAPSYVVQQVATATNADYQFKDDIYTVDCDTQGLPDFSFTTASGSTVTISSDTYLLKIDAKKNICAIEVYATPFMDGWLVGDTLMRAYCHAYDVGQKRIGFAKSIHST